MKTMKILVMLVLVLLASNHVAWACSCIPAQPVSEAYLQAQVVFVGRCTSGVLITKKEGETEEGEAIEFWAARYTFDVQEVLKGTDQGKSITIETGIGSGDCGFEFRLGMSYLVYGYLHNGVLGTSICHRSLLVGYYPSSISDKAKEELQALKVTKR